MKLNFLGGMRRFFCLALGVLLVLSCFDGFGQLNRKSIKKNNRKISAFKGKKFNFGQEKVYNSLGISLNAMNYYGDLAPRPSKLSTDISFTRPAVGISFSHRFGPRYTVTGGFTYGVLRGADIESADDGDMDNGVYRYKRNLSFRNQIKELSLIGTLDLFENQATYISRVRWTPYGFVGVAVFHHNPEALAPATDLHGNPLPEAGRWVKLQPLGTEGQFSNLAEDDINYGIEPYKLFQIAIPMGVGVRFRLNEVMDFSAEIGFRYLFTDYIDDVSGHYVDLDVLNSDLARAMSYRGNETQYITEARPTVARNGNEYNLIPGYGAEHRENMRGNKNDRDIFTVTTFRLTYILGKTLHRAKFR